MNLQAVLLDALGKYPPGASVEEILFTLKSLNFNVGIVQLRTSLNLLVSAGKLEREGARIYRRVSC